jgi:alpha-mannosidase
MDKTIRLIGNAHLDPIWLWRWQEGCGEVLQTFRSALDRLKEYDDFVFTRSSAAYYKWVEDIDPEMFEEINLMIVPYDLIVCMQLALNNDCLWLCLDRDGEILDEIDQYNW